MSRLSFFVDSFPEQHKQGPGIYFLIFLSSFLQFLFVWPLFSLDSPSALFDVLLLHQVVAYVIAFSTEEKNFLRGSEYLVMFITPEYQYISPRNEITCQ